MGGKKSFGVHTKKEEAKNRIEEKKKVEKQAKEKASEDAKWVDNSKDILKKQLKEKELAEKNLEKDKANELKRQQLELEEKELSKAKAKGPVKKTQFQMNQQRLDYLKKLQEKINPESKQVPVNNLPLEANTNHGEIIEGAEGMEEALVYLEKEFGTEAEVDLHPEKRRKAAYMKYLEQRYAEIKAENPGLKRSQIHERVFKEWQTSPDNPMNQQ